MDGEAAAVLGQRAAPAGRRRERGTRHRLRWLFPGGRTLRLRLTLWYVAVLALSTGVVAVLFYVGLETALMDQVDQGIRETAITEAKTSVGDFLQDRRRADGGGDLQRGDDPRAGRGRRHPGRSRSLPPAGRGGAADSRATRP